MDTLIVDGDFEAQLRRNLGSAEAAEHRAFALQALKYDPNAVYKTHLDYLRAGAQVIRTNTYRAAKSTLTTYLNIPVSESLEMITVAVQLAQQAITEYCNNEGGENAEQVVPRQRPLLAGSCGSYAATNFSAEYSIVSRDRNVESYIPHFYKERIEVLLSGGVDLLAFESIPTLMEVEIIIELLQLYPSAQAWITFLCTPQGTLMDGKDFLLVASRCFFTLPKQIIAVGAECHDSDMVKSTIRRANRDLMQVPFLHHVDQCCVRAMCSNSSDVDHAPQITFVKEWLDLGLHFIGGGRNTNAEDIQTICKQVNTYRVSMQNNPEATRPRSCAYRKKNNEDYDNNPRSKL